MKRTSLNLLIDLLAALLFIAMAATGYLLRFPLPPGTNKSLSLWGLTRHSWGEIHVWVSFALLGTLVAHLCLHWQWVVTVVRRQLACTVGGSDSHLRSGLLTAAAVLTVLVLFGVTAHLSVTERPDPCCLPGVDAGPSGTSAEQAARAGPADGKAKVNFAQDVYPILAISCLSCHGPTRARGGFRVDRRKDYFGSSGKPLVVPGKSAESELIAIVSGARKDIEPTDRHRLLEKDVQLLRKWIDEGAEWPERPEPQ